MAPTPEAFAELAELGLTEVITIPWYFSGGDPNDPGHQEESLHWFAETVIAPSATPDLRVVRGRFGAPAVAQRHLPPPTSAPARSLRPMASASPPELNPAQRRTLDALGAAGGDRPAFDADLGDRLRADLDDGLAPVLDDLGPDEDLNLAKHLLSRVHGCEVRFLAEDDEDFVASVPVARGAIAHKAIELGIHWKGEPLPLELVDEAISSLTLSDSWVSDFLQTCSEADQATLRSEAGDKVHKFFECFRRSNLFGVQPH